MKIHKKLRPDRAVKRLDMAELRHLLRDRRVWSKLAVVTAPEDGGDHYELHEEDGKIVDITIEVLTIPDKLDLTCRLGFIGASAGMITIPDVGDEVIVAIPDGEIDFMPAVIAMLPRSGVLDAGAQGPAPARVLIVAAEVLIHDGAGGAVPLALKSDVDALRDYVDNDLMLPVVGGGGGTAQGPATSAPGPSAEGTTVLLAK